MPSRRRKTSGGWAEEEVIISDTCGDTMRSWITVCVGAVLFVQPAAAGTIDERVFSAFEALGLDNMSEIGRVPSFAGACRTGELALCNIGIFGIQFDQSALQRGQERLPPVPRRTSSLTVRASSAARRYGGSVAAHCSHAPSGAASRGALDRRRYLEWFAFMSSGCFSLGNEVWRR
jgi:hypothetical protein